MILLGSPKRHMIHMHLIERQDYDCSIVGRVRRAVARRAGIRSKSASRRNCRSELVFTCAGRVVTVRAGVVVVGGVGIARIDGTIYVRD